MSDYLFCSDLIDWQHPRIMRKARELAVACAAEDALIRRSFEFVRDAVREPASGAPLAVRASDVLAGGTGCCFAKAHLFAALMRANRVPAGFCYQRLACDDDPGRFRLHGLGAVRLSRHGWYRVDLRRPHQGGQPGAFSPPVERFARQAVAAGERDLPEIWPEPLPLVVDALRASDHAADFARNAPDIELVAALR